MSRSVRSLALRLDTPARQRLALIAAAAVVTGGYVASLKLAHPERISDLFQLVVGARAFLAGQDPYAAVRATPALAYPLSYPVPAVLAVTPLVWLPMWAADALFVAVNAAVFAWAITCRRIMSPPLLALVSAPFLHSVMLSQWSPLITGAALLPPLGFLLACKPNVGLALFAAYPNWRTAAGAVALVIVSLALWPAWPWAWRAAIAAAPPSPPLVMFPGGPLLLLPLLRWRHPEARLVTMLGLVPQTTLPYALLPLFLVARTWREGWIIWAGTTMALLGHAWAGPYDSDLAWLRAAGIWMLYCAFLPCVVLVLMRDRRAAWRSTPA